MKRRSFVRNAALTLAAQSMSRGFAEKLSRQPMNLLLITVDDMDHSVQGWMGDTHGATPHLDALAKTCHRFKNVHAAVPICQPSREAFMSGMLPQHSGATGFLPLHDGTQTLVTLLKKHGYYTAGLHKLEHMKPDSSFPWDESLDSHDRNPQEYGEKVTAVFANAKKSGKPFFINCNINDPHRPFYGSKAAMKMDHEETGGYALGTLYKAGDVKVPDFLEDLPAVREEIAQYYNSVRRADITVGRILAALKQSGMERRTMVVFTADHGMPFPFSKATTYVHGTRTPQLLRWPGMGTPKVVEQLAVNIDLMPTILDVLGVKAERPVDGRSWLPVLRGQKRKEKYIVTQVNSLVTGSNYPMRTVTDGNYALVFSPWADGKTTYKSESMVGLTYPAMAEAAKTDARVRARVEQLLHGELMAFYDLEKDPAQRVNRLEEKFYAIQIAEMKEFLLKQMERTGDVELRNYKAYLAGGTPVVKQPEKPKFTHYQYE